ncbi:YjdF family protein [Candidatus Oscillochloris fontis]|uniref:YjdF family protein n=1 Tax=Candidatus Oscillochloris fontis TaxID=2496868 RepID=UPI00101D1332|nr:YjdF family protein [Candidatus Oscillochloris fontis]
MSTFTVYFDDPWWVGVIELDEDRVLRVYRHIFGSEPSNEEVLDFVLNHFIARTTQPMVGVPITPPPQRKINPKRAAREAARRMQVRGISTKAQEALQRDQEAQKQERQRREREEHQQVAAHKRQQAREKAYARRRGH